MATFKSDQITTIEGGGLLSTHDEGRSQRAYFSYTVSGSETIDQDVFELCKIPKGARVLGGVCVHTDLGSAGDIDFDFGWRKVNGTGGDVDAFTATPIAGFGAGAGYKVFGQDVVGDFGVEVTDNAYLVASPLDGGSGALQAGSIKGYVDYL